MGGQNCYVDTMPKSLCEALGVCHFPCSALSGLDIKLLKEFVGLGVASNWSNKNKCCADSDKM